MIVSSITVVRVRELIQTVVILSEAAEVLYNNEIHMSYNLSTSH
jgi:hypothetical protein